MKLDVTFIPADQLLKYLDDFLTDLHKHKEQYIKRGLKIGMSRIEGAIAVVEVLKTNIEDKTTQGGD